MTIEKAYLLYLQLVNRNFTNDNIDVDRSRFILAFNYTQNKYVEWLLDKRNDDSIRDIQELLILDKDLTFDKVVDNHYDYILPTDYFDFSNLKIIANNKECKGKILNSFEVKNDDIEELLADVNNKPSFEYRETFYTVNDNKVSIYVDDFKIEKSKLSYYKYPTQVDIDGYINIDGNNSTNINPEFSDKIVERILIAMSKEFSAINEEFNKYQIDKDRLFNRV